MIRDDLTGFPSPYGDFVFQPTVEKAGQSPTTKSFRPLTGILFFNHPVVFHVHLFHNGFRPLTGILFFNQRRRYTLNRCSLE